MQGRNTQRISFASFPWSGEAGVSPARPILLSAAILVACEFAAAALLPRPWSHSHYATAGLVMFLVGCGFFGRQSFPIVTTAESRLSPRFVFLHAAAAGLAIATETYLLRHSRGEDYSGLPFVVWLWRLAMILLLPSALVAVFPPRTLLRAVRALRRPMFYAAGVALLVMAAVVTLNTAWDSPQSSLGRGMQVAAFASVRSVLQWFYPQVIADPRTFRIGTPRFNDTVGGSCSGMEGLVLVFILTVAWLFASRRELRVARAVWLIPLALATIWVLNIVRIVVLIAIADRGHPAVAMGGFHSQAGWISFNAVSIAFLVLSQRLAWLRRDPVERDRTAAPANSAAIYLLPFLAIIASSLVTQAFSAGFEWLYPLRCLAALLCLWVYRRHYRNIDWRFGWLGPAAGIAVVALWIAFAHLPAAHIVLRTSLPASLAALRPVPRSLWLGFRIFAAVLTVPVAEELAFRGYVARRVLAAEVEEVPYRSLDWKGIVISAAAFGAMHGRLWVAGILAGVAFALVAKRRNRLGEAVAAHAVANLLLAAWVLHTGEYGLW